MFFIHGNGRIWCTPCALAQFVGITGEELTHDNIETFIVNVRNGCEGDQRRRALEEVKSAGQLVATNCPRCNVLFSSLISKKISLPSMNFMPSYAVTDIVTYQSIQEEAVVLPVPEWVPRSGREPLPTDLDRLKWDRRNYVPVEVIPELVRGMRMLVAIDDKERAHGTLLYATENDFVIIQLDEKRVARRDAPIVTYPLSYPGLYVDMESSAEALAIFALCDFHRFQVIISPLSEAERREQTPYVWKYVVVDPRGHTLKGVADTYRAGLSEMYLALCIHGYIDDPSVEMPDGLDMSPF